VSAQLNRIVALNADTDDYQLIEEGGEVDTPMNSRTTWFEVAEVYRRIALTGGLRLLAGGGGVQYAVGLIIAAIGLHVVAAKKRYLTSGMNRLSEIVNWQVLFTLLGAMLVSSGGGKSVDVLLLCIQIGGVALVMLAAGF